MRLPQLKRGCSYPGWKLGREIALTLAIKLLLLYGIWHFYFSHPALPNMIDGLDPDQVAATLVTTPATTQYTTKPHQENTR